MQKYEKNGIQRKKRNKSLSKILAKITKKCIRKPVSGMEGNPFGEVF